MATAGKKLPLHSAGKALAHGRSADPSAEAAASEALQATPRMVAQRRRLASAFGPAPGGPVAQRQIAAWLTANSQTLGGNARFESTANFGDRTGRKPLLAIPSTTPHHELHVHLIPLIPPVSYTGWNLKDLRGGGSYVHIDNTTRTIDAEDRALFDAQAPGWETTSRYPDDIAWSQPSQASRLAEGARQFDLKRQQMVDALRGRLNAHVERQRKSRKITLTMTFTTFARNSKETSSGHKDRVNKAKKLPAVERCTGTLRVQDTGAVTARFVFDTYDDFIAGRAAVIAEMQQPISDGRPWTHGATSDDVVAVELSIRTPAQAYIDAVQSGAHDDVVRAWTGETWLANFP